MDTSYEDFSIFSINIIRVKMLSPDFNHQGFTWIHQDSKADWEFDAIWTSTINNQLDLFISKCSLEVVADFSLSLVKIQRNMQRNPRTFQVEREAHALSDNASRKRSEDAAIDLRDGRRFINATAV